MKKFFSTFMTFPEDVLFRHCEDIFAKKWLELLVASQGETKNP